MTEPMYTDKEYLDLRFNRLETGLKEVRADIAEAREDITGNRVELAKSGGLAALLIAVVEFLRYGVKSQ